MQNSEKEKEQVRIKHNGDLIAYLVLHFSLSVFTICAFHTQTESLDMTSKETETPRNLFYNGKL